MEVLKKSHFSLQMGNCPIIIAKHSGQYYPIKNKSTKLEYSDFELGQGSDMFLGFETKLTTTRKAGFCRQLQEFRALLPFTVEIKLDTVVRFHVQSKTTRFA